MSRLSIFFKQLFCRHYYERVDTYIAKVMLKPKRVICYRCSKCGKILYVKLPY